MDTHVHSEFGKLNIASTSYYKPTFIYSHDNGREQLAFNTDDPLNTEALSFYVESRQNTPWEISNILKYVTYVLGEKKKRPLTNVQRHILTAFREFIQNTPGKNAIKVENRFRTPEPRPAAQKQPKKKIGTLVMSEHNKGDIDTTYRKLWIPHTKKKLKVMPLRIDHNEKVIMFTDGGNSKLQDALDQNGLDSVNRIQSGEALIHRNSTYKDFIVGFDIRSQNREFSIADRKLIYSSALPAPKRAMKRRQRDSGENRSDVIRRKAQCDTCPCTLTITKYHQSSTASPSVQLWVQNKTTQQTHFMKLFLEPESVCQAGGFWCHEFKALVHEEKVYSYITDYFKLHKNNPYKHNFIKLARSECRYKSLSELTASIHNNCTQCQTLIAQRLVETVCPPEEKCPFEPNELNTFVRSIPVRAFVTELCPNTMSLEQFIYTTFILPGDKLRVAVKILEVAQFIHSELKLHHLDLHVKNILICQKQGKWTPLFFDWDRSQAPDDVSNNTNTNIDVLLQIPSIRVNLNGYESILDKMYLYVILQEINEVTNRTFTNQDALTVLFPGNGSQNIQKLLGFMSQSWDRTPWSYANIYKRHLTDHGVFDNPINSELMRTLLQS